MGVQRSRRLRHTGMLDGRVAERSSVAMIASPREVTMFVRRSMMRMAPALMMVLLMPAAVWAQNRGWGNGGGRNGGSSGNGRELFQWMGRVDREVQISMRDDNV